MNEAVGSQAGQTQQSDSNDWRYRAICLILFVLLFNARPFELTVNSGLDAHASHSAFPMHAHSQYGNEGVGDKQCACSPPPGASTPRSYIDEARVWADLTRDLTAS